MTLDICFSLVLQRRAVFQGTLVRGSPARVYPEHLQHSGYSLAYVRHPSATSLLLPMMGRGLQTCWAFSSWSCRGPAATITVHFVGMRLDNHTAASHVPLSRRRGGVPTDSCMESRPGTMDGISPADPKGIFTEVYHTSRIIRKGQTVKLSSMSNVKCKDVYHVRIRIPLRYYPWQPQSECWMLATLAIVDSQKKSGKQDTAEAFVFVQSSFIYIY